MLPSTALTAWAAEQAALTDCTITIGEMTYTGGTIEPSVTVKSRDGVTTYASGTDYTVSYEPAVIKDAGTYTATFTAAAGGLLTGTATKTFEVKPADFSKAKIEYNGTTLKSAFTGFDSAKEGDIISLPSGSSVNVTGIDSSFYQQQPEVTKVDNNTIRIDVYKITGAGNNVIGPVSAFINVTLTYSLNDYKLIGTDKDGKIKDMVYNDGKELKPAVYVVPKTNTGTSTTGKLTEGKDFTLTYTDNKYGGYTATVTAEGIGNYSGEISNTFSILGKSIEKLTISPKNTKQNEKPTFEIKDGSTVLSEGTDYSVRDWNSSSIGSQKGTATIAGIGNYTDTKVVKFNVIDEKYVISYSDVECKDKNALYTGKEQSITTTVTLNNKTLRSGTDYTITYYDYEATEDKDKDVAVKPKNVSTYAVYLQGKGDYAADNSTDKGLYLTTFTIQPISLDRITVNFSSSTHYDSTARATVPNVSLKASNGASIPETDYNVNYYGFNSTYRTQYVVVTPVEKGKKAKGQDDASTGSLTGGTGDRTTSIEEDYTGATISQTTAKNITVDVDKAYYKDGTKQEKVTISNNTINYVGEKIYLDISVYDGTSRRYLEAYEYTVTYKNSDKKTVSYLYDADTYTIVVESTSNYENNYNRNFKVEKTFKISGESISGYTVTLDKYSINATGSNVTLPKVLSVFKGSSKISAVDYTVTYQDSTGKTVTSIKNPGTYKAVVTGKNSYSGTTYAQFTVVGLTQSITGVSSSYKVYPNGTLQLYPKATEGSFTYTSSDSSVATVSATGLVTAHKAGRAKITITTTGNTKYDQVSKSTVIKVYPKKAVITQKPWTGGKKAQLKVRWNKQENVTGYEIRYSRSKNFAKGTYLTKKVNAAENDYTTQSTTIKNLKSGYTYYVKVRAVKEVYNDNGKKITYYGAWSGWRSVKVK